MGWCLTGDKPLPKPILTQMSQAIIVYDPIWCQTYWLALLLFPKFPLVFATFGNIDSKVFSLPDEAVSHGNSVRQGPKARTQKLPTGETTG